MRVTLTNQISGPLLDIYFYFNIPTGEMGTSLALNFTDLDLKPWNDPNGFFERLGIYDGQANIPSGTFENWAEVEALPNVAVIKSGTNNNNISIEFSGLTIEPAGGDFWLHLGFNAYSSGLSGNWYNTEERIRTTMTTSPAPVPEPATLLLFGSGLAGLAGAMRRRKI